MSMCDTVAGELIISFAKDDEAALALIEDIRAEKIGHVAYIESLEDKVRRMELIADPVIDHEFHRVRVPYGQEQWKVTYLQFFYKTKMLGFGAETDVDRFLEFHSYSVNQFNVGPNYLLSLASKVSASDVRSTDFSFSACHEEYKKMLGMPSKAPDIRRVSIIVMDTGIADDLNPNRSGNRNFVDPARSGIVTDDHGHGTVIARIIEEIAPGVSLTIYKVADADGRASEWDLLAALSTFSSAHVVNISLAYGLEDRKCKTCGRESHSSRSLAFESLITSSIKQGGPILVSAAGNLGDNCLAYPARFAQLIAVGSINSHYALSPFSNYGAEDQEGKAHENHYVLPGGDNSYAAPESIGGYGKKDQQWGTSFATAYATGIVANRIANAGITTYDREATLGLLRNSALTKSLQNYSIEKHGYGLMQI